MAETQKQDKALALLGVAEVEYLPSIRATAEGAHSLTQATVIMAHHALQEEYDSGSEVPPLTVKQRDPETGEMKDVLNRSYEIVLRERALYYLQSLKLEAEASTLEILAEIFERQLYMDHPDRWGSLADFLRNMAAGKSASYHSIVEGLVTIILPFLQVEGLATVREMMELVTEGGMSNLYHLKAEMVMAAQAGDKQAMAELLTDARSLTRSEIYAKYKKTRVPPARARLGSANPHSAIPTVVMEEKVAFLPRRMGAKYQLVIEMDEKQKRIVLNRLGRRIAYE